MFTPLTVAITFLIFSTCSRTIQSQIHYHGHNPLYSFENAISAFALSANKAHVKQYWQQIHQFHPSNMTQLFHNLHATMGLLAPDHQCSRDIGEIIQQMRQRSIAGFQWLDAIGRPPPGLTAGAILWPGSFDLCMSISENMFPSFNNASSHYCSMLLSIPRPNASMTLHIGITTGLCLPRSCEPEWILKFINSTISRTGLVVDEAGSYCHTSPESLPKDAAFWVAICTIVLVALPMLLGSIVDSVIYLSWQNRSLIGGYTSLGSRPGAEFQDTDDDPILDVNGFREGTVGESVTRMTVEVQPSGEPSYDPASLLMSFWEYRSELLAQHSLLIKLICCFSVPYNSHKLFHMTQTQSGTEKSMDEKQHPLEFLNGIRVLTMVWIIYGHTIVFFLFVTNNLLVYAQRNARRWTFEVIVAGTLSVDTFFMLSGLLAAYTVIPRFRLVNGLSNKLRFWSVFIVHRFIRMTPAYIFVIILYTGLFHHLYDGPFYPQRPELLDSQFCRQHGWVTYLNNFIYPKQMCLYWSWYLANDFQFSVVLAPIFIVFTNWKPIAGCIFSTLLILSSTFATFAIAFDGDCYPGILSTINDGFITIYIKPYTRWGTYAIGLSLGWILLEKFKPSERLPMILKRIFPWICLAFASILCLSTVYGMYSLVSGQVDSWTTSVSAFYTAVHRPVFTLGVAVVIYLCAMGYTPLIGCILGWRPFTPLARLTYGAYLIHPLVILFYALGSQGPVLLDNLFLITHFFSAYLMSYGLAFVISMATEAPLLEMEKIIRLR